MLIHRLERLAPWGAGLLLAAPIVIVRYPPMADLPMHEALVALLLHRGDPTWAPSGMYFVVAPQANQLFYLLAYALSFVFGTALGCKLVVAGTVLAAPVALARLLGALRASRWPALLVGPIACGWTFRWGLAANLLGFVLFVFALPLLERLARRPSRRAAVSAVGAACGLFFAHQSSGLAFAIVAGYFAIVRWGEWRAIAARSLPALAPLLLALVQFRVSRALAGATMQAIGNDYGLDPLARLRLLPGAVFGGFDPLRLGVLAGVSLLALAAQAVARGRPSAQDLGLRVGLWRHRYPVLAAIFFFLFLGFPMSLGGTTLLAHRFLPAACVFLIVACAPRTGGLPRALLAVAVPITMLGVELRSFVDSDRRFRDLDEVLLQLPKNVAVAQLDLTPRARSVVAPVPGAASRALAERGGRMLFMMTDMPPNPVYLRPDRQWNEPMLRMAPNPYAFMPAYDAQRFAYLLVRNAAPAARALAARALLPEVVLVASKGEWELYRSTLPVGPIAAPDRPLPSPAPETLGERVMRLLAADRAARPPAAP